MRELTERQVPADVAAERATLGSILLEREAILALAPWLTPGHFYLEKHAWIYEAMVTCTQRRVPPDLTTVANELRRRERLDLVGGISYLGELSADVPTAVHVEYYATIVEQTARRRQLITAGGQIVALGYAEDQEVDTVLDVAEQTLFAVTQRPGQAGFVPSVTAVDAYFQQQQHGTHQKLATGFVDLDRVLQGGLRPGNLILLAARPSVGKSALATCIAYNLALQQGKTVGIVSLEMTQEEIVERLAAIHTGLSTSTVARRVAACDPDLLETLGVLSNAVVFFNDAGSSSIMDVRAEARRLTVQHPLDLLIVDYIQLLLGDSRTTNRVDEVSRISRQLKLLAKELRCPILALSQLSRAVEGRASHVPQLSDLRDSGALEQDADVVLFIYREELYTLETQKRGIAEIYVAKQRNGPLGMIPLRFEAETTRFQSLALQMR